MTMRDCHRLIRYQEARKYCLGFESNVDGPTQFMKTCVLPLILFMEREDPRLWNNVRTGTDLDAVYKYGKGLDSFNEVLDIVLHQALGLSSSDADSEITDEIRRQYVRDICAVLYIDDSNDPRLVAARQRRIAVPWGRQDARVYHTLDFPA